MATVKQTLQRPTKRVRQHAPPLPGVTEWTGTLLQHKVNSVGWLALGQVHEAAGQASFIMTTTEIAQVRNSIVYCNCKVTQHKLRHFNLSCIHVEVL